MARAAVLGRLTWRVGTVVAVREETSTARTIALEVPDWPGHLAGQHVDLRLTAADGYSTQRSYSIASAPQSDRLELTVEQVPDGEVSPYLTQVLAVGDLVELRGPVGGWFVWRPETPEPVLLVGGGSGLVPLMAMIRTRAAKDSRVPFRLVYSVRDPQSILYTDELRRRGRHDPGLDIAYAYTRRVPEGWPRPPHRVDADLLTTNGWPPELSPACFVCGPTGFVETVAELLVGAGHDPARIHTERFGPSGGHR
jgi:ferredoxin-NADP reductase